MLMLIFVFIACVDFYDRFKHQFKQCKKVIQVVNNRQASREGDHILAYEPIYRHMIPHKIEELSRISLPSLHIKGRAP